MHTLRTFSFFTLFTLLALLSPRAHATIILYQDDEALTKLSDAVVMGSVVQKQVVMRNNFIVTESEVRVEEVIKGTAIPSSIIMRTPGGTMPGGVGSFIAGSPSNSGQVGDKIVVFLKRNSDATYSVHSLALGLYRLIYNGVTRSFDAHRDLDEVLFLNPVPTRDGSQRPVMIPEDRPAGDVVTKLRQYAAAH